MDNLNVQGLHLVAAGHGASGDWITVRVDAVAAQYVVDETTGALVEGDRADTRFSRYCTFERAAGTLTPRFGVLDSRCPRCGSALSLGEDGECRHCGAAVSSGHFDWVLNRFETGEEWNHRQLSAMALSGSGA
jgi:hypothetical protein